MGHDELQEFFTSSCIRCPAEVRKLLPLDELNFRKMGVMCHSDARAYFIYGVLDEVQRVGTAMMRWQGLLEDEEDRKRDREGAEQMNRIVMGAIADEQSMWRRRLLEALVTLICFQETNEDGYYRHFLLLEDLRNQLFAARDLDSFFDCVSEQVKKGAEIFLNGIRELEQHLDLSRCWYMQNAGALPAEPNPMRLVVSFRSMLKTALPLAAPRERMQIGLSYQSFSEASEHIHFGPEERRREHTTTTLELGLSRCGMLGQSVLLRCLHLLGCVPLGFCSELVKSYERNEVPDALAKKLYSGRGRVGDFVVVGNSLAEILEVAANDYGYERYRIRYLADPPMPEIAEDWMMPQRIRTVMTKESLTAALEKFGANESTPEELREAVTTANGDAMADAMREAVRFAWQVGLKDALFARNASADAGGPQMPIINPYVLQQHEQKYQVSCIPSSVELVLKHEGAVGADFYDLQEQWKNKTDGSFGEFDGVELHGFRFQRGYTGRPGTTEFDQFVAMVRQELAANRPLVISLKSDGGHHMWLIVGEANNEFVAMSRAHNNPKPLVTTSVLSLIGKMGGGTDYLAYSEIEIDRKELNGEK